tara:strand:- start:249 stop:848 length:600 start_codon:yes stop_codon:yes gene_type:complete
MIVIGLTGGIGSGKSTITKYLKNKRIPVFDSDYEVGLLYKNKNKDLIAVIKKITDTNQIIKKSKINKKLLGDIVFNNKKKLKFLEKVIFNKLDKKRKIFLKKNKNKKLVVLDAPLLFENKINKICDYVILAKAPLKTRIRRILKRPGMTKLKAKKIISRQMGDNKKTKLANFIVQTSFGKWYTIKSVEKILNKKYLKKN